MCLPYSAPIGPTLPAFVHPARPRYILQPMNCHACGASLSPTARVFPQNCAAGGPCGAAVGSAGATGWRAGLPWGLAGAAFGALITVVAMRSLATPSRADEPGATAVAPFAGGAGGGQPPDISQMSPEERANRLFNRVMLLAESGKQDSVQFFLPMALGAYAQLPTLDADARYHIGMLELAGGNANAALAQADTIGRSISTHLFTYVLRAPAYRGAGNKQLEARAYADFLRNEPAELAKKRPEYGADAHQDALNSFHGEAVRQGRTGRTS